jgi:spore coat-associated protein N
VGRRMKSRRRRLGALGAALGGRTKAGWPITPLGGRRQWLLRTAGGPAAGAVGGAAPAAAPSDGPPTVAPADPARDGNRKRTLASLALGLIAIATAVGSGADFSARTANPSNTFSAGALSMENSKDGTAILNAHGMKPGDAPKTGVVDIENTGSIDGVFKVSRDELTSSDPGNDNPSPFATKVAIGVVDCGTFGINNSAYGPEPATPICGDADDHTLYLGSLANQNSPIELGTYQPGEKHRYDFEASLDASAGDAYQGDSASARYVFDATQTP